jgi:hypothetical protein
VGDGVLPKHCVGDADRWIDNKHWVKKNTVCVLVTQSAGMPAMCDTE